MIIETVRGELAKEHQASFTVILNTDDRLFIQLENENRKISEVAADFEDLDAIRTEDGQVYTEYTELTVIFRVKPGTVQVQIGRARA